MLSDWITLCSYAGYDVARLSQTQLCELYGKIVAEPRLKHAALKFLKGSVLPVSARSQVLRGMNAAQLEDLRQRISGH